jgi:hypothetical protein
MKQYPGHAKDVDLDTRYPDSVTRTYPRPTRLDEPVRTWAGWLNKALALATVARRHARRLSSEEYAASVRALSRQAARAPSLRRRIWTLWRIEGLTFACADRSAGEFLLRGAALPLEAGPPAACGLSMAAVLEVGFDAERLTGLLEDRADPRFVDFAFESLGLMLAAYEPDLFGRLSAALGKLGIMRRYNLTPPKPDEFLSALPAEYQPYAAHGFGRLLYFKRHSLRSVIASLSERPHLRFTPALKGAIAAYVLVNGGQLPRILALADEDLASEVESGIRGGLQNVVTLLAWSLPGCLDGVAAPGPRGAALLEAALGEARRRRDHGDGPGLRP